MTFPVNRPDPQPPPDPPQPGLRPLGQLGSGQLTSNCRSRGSACREGAVEGEPAAGVGEVQSAVGVPGDGPAQDVDEVVMVDVAEQGQVVQAGGAALAPGADVVGGGPGGQR